MLKYFRRTSTLRKFFNTKLFRAIPGYLFKTLILLVNNYIGYIRICAVALTIP